MDWGTVPNRGWVTTSGGYGSVCGIIEIRMGCDGWGFMEGGLWKWAISYFAAFHRGDRIFIRLGLYSRVFVALLERNSTVAGVESRPVSPPQKDQQVQNIFFSEQRRGSSI